MTKDGDDVEIDVIALPCWWVTLPPRPLTGGVRQTQLPPLPPLCPLCPIFFPISSAAITELRFSP